MPPHRLLHLGIIGLGPQWETHYQPALARLARRIRITAVYDPAAPRAARVADELQAKHSPGLRALLTRTDVHAALVLDNAWHGLAPLRFALDSRKPLYVALPLSTPHAVLADLSGKAAAHGVLITPELRLRAAPATTRIHELAASRLGPVIHVALSIAPDPADPLASLVQAIDWCSELVRWIPGGVSIQRLPAGGANVSIPFRRADRRGGPASATIRLLAAEPPGLSAHIVCRQGAVQLTGPADLRWQADDEAVCEPVELERSDVETLIDHFARRVAGGLVPVPGLDDVCRILELLTPHRHVLAAAFGSDVLPLPPSTRTET